MIETDIPYIDTHLNIALSLYQQRENCLNQKYVDSSVQHSIEKRLLVHLFVLTHSVDLDEPKPKDDAGLFVYVSRRLLSPDKDIRKQILLFSKQIFIDFPKPAGLIDAFILFYNIDVNQLLKELFETNKELRSIIISIWSYRNEKVSLGLLNKSELQTQDTELQKSVLNYHAERDDVSLDLFQRYYGSLITDVQKENLTSDVLHASLWGGMLRQDNNILTAIRRAIELESDEQKREIFLRLAALNGNSDFLAIFKLVAENKPEFGSYLIALLGKSESIKSLFSMLQNPRISVLIIPAWQLITGQKLKVVPRLSLVDENQPGKSSVDESEDIPLMADVESAKNWATKNVSEWQQDARYFHGVICDKNNLLVLCRQLSGKIAKDAFDLLSLNSNDKLNLKLNSWVLDRFDVLNNLTTNNAVSSGIK